MCTQDPFLPDPPGGPASCGALKVPGYASGVVAPERVQAGRFSLQAGVHKVSFMIRGKSPRSTGYLVGIHRIVFHPAGQP